MIILLTGPNEFSARQELDKLLAAFLNKHGAHAIDRIDGESFDVSRLPDVLQGVSLFASHRLVIMRDASKNKPLWDALSDWSERVPTEVTLALVDASPDKRSRTYKQLQKHADVRVYEQLRDAELARWIQSVAKAEGASCDAKAANYLIAQVGNDQWRLNNELRKLCAASNVVTMQNIDELVEPSPQATAFELLDAVLAGDQVKATRLLARLKTVEDPYKLFGLLVSQVQTLALVVSAQGKSAETVAKETGVHPFVVRKMQAVARSIQYTQLRVVIRSVAQTDTRMKSSGVDPWILLEQCLGVVAAKIF